MNETDTRNKDFDMLEQVVGEVSELYTAFRNMQDVHMVGKKNIPEKLSDYDLIRDSFNVYLTLMNYQLKEWNTYIDQRCKK